MRETIISKETQVTVDVECDITFEDVVQFIKKASKEEKKKIAQRLMEYGPRRSLDDEIKAEHFENVIDKYSLEEIQAALPA